MGKKITDTDKSLLVRIIIWFLIVVSFVGILMRFTAKANRRQFAGRLKITLDDLFIIIAFIFEVANSVAVDFSVASGLGKEFPALSFSDQVKFEKSAYAAGLLYIWMLLAAKLSAVVLLVSVSPKTSHRFIAQILGGFVLLWALASFLALSFECDPPKTWDIFYGKCVDHQAFWVFFEIVNLITDVSLTLVPLWIIWRTSARTIRKINMSLPFLVRVGAVVAEAFKLYFWLRVHSTMDTSFFEFWKIAISDAVIESLEILPLCFIYLRAFLDSLDSGFIGVDDLRRRGETDILGFGGSEYVTSKYPLSTARDHDAYVRLHGNGERHERFGSVPGSAAEAFRGRTKEDEVLREIPMEHIEVRRDLHVIEETIGSR